MPFPPVPVMPPAPSRSDDGNTFSAKADATFAALPNTISGMNALGGYLDGLAVEVDADAAAAAASALASAASALQSANSASAAAASALQSANSATASDAARAASVVAQLAAEAALDAFDDKYLGVKTADPTLDNDGNPLQAGAFYINAATGFIRAYTGSMWAQGISAIAGVSSVNGQMGDVIVRAGYDSRRITANTTLEMDTEYETGSGFAVAPGVTFTVPANTDLVIHRRAAGTVL